MKNRLKGVLLLIFAIPIAVIFTLICFFIFMYLFIVEGIEMCITNRNLDRCRWCN